MNITSQQLDRAIGAVVGTAAGDALGSQYEFGPSHGDDFVPEFGVGAFGHGAGEWTDDTSMAIPILEAIARGDSLRHPATLGRIVGEWDAWSRTALDVGAQTRAVLTGLRGEYTEAAARAQARRFHERSGRSGGNGSLMRTSPVALAYLHDGAEQHLVEAAGRVAQLTHWEDDNVDAVAIWSGAIRHAIRTGELAVSAAPWAPAGERAERWAALIDEALAPGAHPRDFAGHNGWVVRAFQAALSAVAGARDFRSAIHRAIQGGGDTDTVAAIAGALAGARSGASQIPMSWQRRLHGWPGYRVNDLVRLAALAARRGEPDGSGWPSGDSALRAGLAHTAPVRHPFDDGVWLGSQSALSALPESVSAVVSLSRLGTKEVPDGVESIRFWLVDREDANLNLEHTLADAADTIAELRAEGKEVFVHCAEARSRTAAVAALYAARNLGVELEDAWRAVERVLPLFAPAPFLRAAVGRVVRGGGPGAGSPAVVAKP